MRPLAVNELLERAFVPNGTPDVDELQSERTEIAADALRRVRAYPSQFKVVQAIATAKQSATVTPRRTGKSTALSCWIFARVVARDKYVVRILTEVLAAPTDNFLDCADKPSFMDLVEDYGLGGHCRVIHASGSIKSIRFSWGSEIHVEDIGTLRAIHRKRGFSANLYICDEAQSVGLLGVALKKLVRPTMGDHDAQLALFGTPGEDIDSLLYMIAHSDDGTWLVRRFYSWDSPHFGATDDERWSNIVTMIMVPGRHDYGLSDEDIDKIRGLTRDQRIAMANCESLGDELDEWAKDLDPDLLREMFGRWIYGGKTYVYRWHKPKAHCMYWARVADPIYAPPEDSDLMVLANTLAGRIAQLPRRQVFDQMVPRAWDAVVSSDPGTENGPSGSAFDVLVYSDNYDHVLVLWSEIQETFHITEVLDHTANIVTILQQHGIRVCNVVGDFASLGGTAQQWTEEFAGRLPSNVRFELPSKANKREQIAIVNMDIMSGRILFIAGDELDAEGRNLRYKPFRPEQGGRPDIDKWRMVTLPNQQQRRLADHNLDALRYGAPFCPLLFQERLPEMEILSPVEQARRRMVEGEDYLTRSRR